MTIETLQVIPAVEAADQAAEAVVPEMVFMVRDPDKGGMGMTRLMVPAAEVSNYEAAGWYRPEE